MLYLYENSTNIYIPKNDYGEAMEITLEHQVTHDKKTFNIIDEGANVYYYMINVSEWLEWLKNGQYDYFMKDINGTIKESGILQFGEYVPVVEKTKYESEIKIKQYNG